MKEFKVSKLNLTWFDKQYDHIFFITLSFLLEILFILVILKSYNIKSIATLIFFIILITVMILTWFFIFSYKFTLKINFEKKELICNRSVFGLKRDLVVLSIDNIISVKSEGTYTPPGGCNFYLLVKTKESIVRKEILTLSCISERSYEYYKYYIDLLNLWITNQLKEICNKIISKLLTNINETIPLDLNLNDLKKKAKVLSHHRRFSIDLFSGVVIFLNVLFFYSIVVHLFLMI